ncbi:MAG: tetratricopeptide repeat protein [Planctomycetaceae bacterium]
MTDLELSSGQGSVVVGTEQNFEEIALNRSNEIPVVVDFWAEWCAPCRQIAPLLEQICSDSAGQMLLVKVNVEEQPRLAQYFGVQSIPAVFVLRNSQIADHFAGVQPESALRAWLARFLPSPVERLLREAGALESSDPSAAETLYREALESGPREDVVRIALARFLLKQHRNSDARSLIEQLEARGFLEPEAQALRDELDLRLAAAESGGVAQCRSALAAQPGDPVLSLQLADALGATQQFEEALELCLNVVQSCQGESREHARATMVKLFHLLGNEAELARVYRRKLATALY